MDLDLVTNGSAIRNCISQLNSGNISWIVLGYTNNKSINVVESGGDSFEDMFEEFDSNKIMYGFAAVTDPNSKLKKNVFIHWQGEAASQAMKTMSVQHANVIRNLCKPIHVTHHARDEQDLDLKEIMVKVASASGSNYSCHNETKQVYQHVGSVKSEENTANSMRQNRLKELSDLGNLQKDCVPEQHVGSTYEKVNAAKEIENSRTKTTENSYPSKPINNNHTKINPTSEIKASPQISDRKSSSYQKVGTNYVKVDASKEIKSFGGSVPLSQNSVTGYKKIDPQQELKPSNLSQKAIFENKAKVQSENNTAQKAKEERQKELSSLFNKRTNYDDEACAKVGTNYTRINPVAEIKKLRSASITKEHDAAPMSPSSTYKKIDPSEEFRNIRRTSSSEPNEPTSPGTFYKKIDPAEEIRKLRSQSTFDDVRPATHTYKKIDPKEEINSIRKLSTPFIKTNFEPIEEPAPKTPIFTEAKPATVISARQSFENAHKTNDVNPVHKIHNTKQESKQEPIVSAYNTRQNEPPTVLPVVVEQVQSVVDDVNIEPAISKNETLVNHSLDNTAVAQFQYEATDNDEISFEEGEIIRDIEVIDDDWWQGINASGQRGMFPSNYVMPNNVHQPKKEERRVVLTETPVAHGDVSLGINGAINDSPLPATANTISSCPVSDADVSNDLSAVAIYDYQANDCDEISFDIGELIKGIEQIDDGWWIGINKDGVKGMFPSNFVELTTATEARPDTEGDINEGHSDNSESVTDPGQQPVPDTECVTVRAIYDYSAQGDDEVTFTSGDLIYNVAMIDPGWWEGTVATGQRGLFPSNYVDTA